MPVLYSIRITLSDPKPPSVNHLYTNGYRGKKVLSKDGVAFKSAMTREVVRACMALPWKEAVDAVYQHRAFVRTTLWLYAPIYNGSWKPGGVTPSGAAQSPYKKIDGPNFLKVVDDAVAEGTGIDDSVHLSTTVHKVHNKASCIEVLYEVLGEE